MLGRGGPEGSAGGCPGFEVVDQSLEVIHEFRVVEIRILMGERDDLAVVVGGLAMVAFGLVQPAETFVAVMDAGEAGQNVVGSLLGLIELLCGDQGEHGVGRVVQIVIAVLAEERREWRRCSAFTRRAGGRLVIGHAAALVFLAAAAGAEIIPSDFGHLANFSSKDGCPLYQAVLVDAKFQEQLLLFDRDIAATARAAGCTTCGGTLHSARFQRKPRGVPDGLGEAFCQRFSFCCAADGCRKRTTPASLRFLGRKVYLATVVTLISAMRHGVTAARLRQLSAALGIDRRTVARWRSWWLSTFTAAESALRPIAAAAFVPPVDLSTLPASLLGRFAGGIEQKLVFLLRFIGPLTGGGSAMRAF